MLKVWSRNGLVDGVLFSTLTPIKGAGDDGLRLTREQRVWVVGKLLELKGPYGDFLAMTPDMIRRLHPDHTATLTPSRCFVGRGVESYDASGRRKPQCILTDRADCNECGCVIHTMTSIPRPLPVGAPAAPATRGGAARARHGRH